MKMSKKAINRLQNLTLLLLTLSALTLLTRIPLFSEGWNDQVQAFFSTDSSGDLIPQTGNLAVVMPSVHLVSTNDSEYGRHSQLYLDAASPELANVLPLFRDAMGSAANAVSASDRAFQVALNSPGLFLTLTTPLPSGVIADWLGSETALAQDVRSLALITSDDESAALYLCGPHGSIFRYDTALTATAVYDCVATLSPNGGSFAFESNHHSLQPYTVLTAQTAAYTDIYSAIPDGYSAYNLLTALDFNAHTNSRYFETSGTEVVQESPRTLRISPDGIVVYSGDKFVDSPLYQVSSPGEPTTADSALQAAMRLAAVITIGTDASPLHLRSISGANNIWQIEFSYQTQGLPVLLPDNTPALSVTITDGVITAFTYRCRSFTPAETLSTLLPPSMAAAIAAQHPQSALTLSYTDSGENVLSAHWLAG